MKPKQPAPKRQREREPQPNPVPCPEIETTPIKNHRIRDMRGQNINYLTVYAFAHHTEGRVYWKCWCDCGTLCEVSAYALQNNKRKSCGCLNTAGRKGDAAIRKSIKKRHTILKRLKAGVPIQDPPIIVDGDPAVAFAHDALLSYACLQWANYEPAAHHRLIAQYLERVERGEIKRLMITMPPRHGKECAHSTPVLTADGWKTHGELKVGDFVFHPSGNPIEVLAESISSGDMFETHQDDFLVKTTSGETIRCHARHEWRVFDRLMNQWRVVETHYLFSQPPGHGPVGKRGYHYRFKLPDTSSVLFDHADLPLDPYFLGVWLGDGTSTGADFVYHPKDREPRDEIERRGFVVTSESAHQTTGVIKAGFGQQGIRQVLRELKIFGEKHIPEIYLRSSLEQRLDLLAGLIDTDGHVERSTGRVRIATVSTLLKDTIVDLLIGLGQRPYVFEQQPCTSTSGIVGRQLVFYIGFQPTLDVPTKIPRKQIDHLLIDRRCLSIAEVLYQPNGEKGKCIQVDSPDGLYLVGRTLIPTHNSMLLSEYFPAWYLGRNPDKRVIATSYGQDLASDFGRKVRNQIADPLFQEIFPDVKLAEDSAAVDKFNLAHPKTGGYFAVGVGGALTGRGANCLPGDTKILTSHGIVDISDILRYNSPVMALSFSEKNNAFVWSPIVAVSRRKTHELVRVVTDRGSITCTPEHPFYIAGVGYIEAQALTAGQGLCTCELPSLRKGISERSACNRGVDREQQRSELLLLSGMQISACQGRSEDSPGICADEGVFDVREGVSSEAGIRGISEILLNEMLLSAHRSGTVESPDYRGMPILWKRLLQQGQHPTALLKSVCEQNPLGENAWEGQLKLSGRIRDSQGRVKTDDARNYGERWVAVCGLPRNGESARSSYRSEPNKQCNGEYGNALPDLPHASPQDCGKATVRVVESLHNELVEVYDIEVFEHHNFVAINDQGTPMVLRNCLIIDDPLRNREDADSEANRRKLKNWYTAVAYTRLMDSGSIIICQTRWTQDDLAGWLLKEHRHENWIHLDLPAINEKGEALWPERYPIEELEKIRRTLPTRDWLALYQQQPFAEEGGIFKRDWWKRWPDKKPFPECDYVIQSWDTAFSDKDVKSNSYSARTTWGVFRHPDDDYANLILLETWKGHVDYSDLRKESLRAYKEYNPDKVIIEKRASGQCYDDQTEVLTRNGWKLFSEINIEYDEFATRNTETHEFQWQKATGEFHDNYSGDMYHFYGRTHNVMVTPNHRMLVNTLPLSIGGCAAYRIRGEDTFITAEELANYGLEKTKTPMLSVWNGVEIIEKELNSESFVKSYTGNEPSTLVVSGDDYVKFMAMYLAEGWTSHNKKHRFYGVHIGQYEKSVSYNEFLTVMSRIGKVQTRRGKEMYLTNRRLYEFVRQYGLKCDQKRIPDDIMNASSRQLKLFFDYYMMGDGHITKAGRSSISTTSPFLAGQLQEVAQKIGFSASVRLKSVRKNPIYIGNNKNPTYPENFKPSYVVGLRISKAQKLIPHKVQYNGKIHCVSVPNGVVYVRRNGWPLWCGNSLLQDLRRAGLPVVAWMPERDKITRAYAAQSLFENGRVYYPDRQWAEAVIDELAAFPQGTHDDVVDTVSQAFMWVQRSWLVRNSADVDAEREEELPSNVTRLKPKRAAYG